MGTLLGNLRYSFRMLRKHPGLTAAVVLTLMLGIGATTAIYTVVYAVLLAPLPYPHPEQLVMIWSKVSGHNNALSAGDFLDWKEQSKSFQQLAAWTGGSFNLATAEQPEQIAGKRATPGWFAMQGIPFLMGRDFLPQEGVPGRDRQRVALPSPKGHGLPRATHEGRLESDVQRLPRAIARSAGRGSSTRARRLGHAVAAPLASAA